MAALSAQSVTTTGTVLTFNTCAAGGDTVPYGSTVLFRNTDPATVTVTMVTPGSVDDNLAVADRTFTVAQNAIVAVQPDRDYRNDAAGASHNTVAFTYSGVTALTAAVFN